ncbi:5-formyltetrahydrofolate cyclo-ligase [Umezawaea beigongshangensis]|uniref:5-formyltetrahydrofolate cyclo-ligase n=1 Tax=Umezawaea beigongshangensis TaxID=2780383 RepID=UPI0018F1AFEE|nr:5-formyltetrahydrofolate cyclo-ligase [Umezawaea beigongshangensis]
MTSGSRDHKVTLRTRLLAARRAVPDSARREEAAALVAHVPSLLTALAVPVGAEVCAYLPIGSEPGSVALLEALRAHGHRVLLPVVVGAAPLDWAVHTGPEGLRPGPHGLREPSGPLLGPAAVGGAGLVLVPALAVDRRGARLGRGGGHYDRTLPAAVAPLVAVVRDEEFVAELPHEEHDVRMTAVLTPERGLTRL